MAERLNHEGDEPELEWPSQRLRRGRSYPASDNETPPDDYTDITIFPDTEEINTSIEPFLRANKTKGPYRDLQHYLDIHARLMKEDYVAPIREGLKEYRDAQENERKPKESDLRFYYDVKLVTIKCEPQGITHFVSFNNSSLKHVDWEFSMRLIFGSLLVFTKDDFETVTFATVANKDVAKVKRGIIQVIFQNHLEVVFTSSENDTYIMAETTAFFESYRHVLEGLIAMRTIPFQKHIIYCKREISPPKYLNKNSSYNLNTIMTETYDEFPVSILADSNWPDCSETELNDLQYKALKLALTKELAVIQGPPGTGKTYLGLKIMDILLENKSHVRCEGPILVVCYTNHAIDQFLEGVLEFCTDGIVRVGGRSKSEKLEKFNLQELRKKYSYQKKDERLISKYKKRMKYISTFIDELWQETIRLETTILKVEDLNDVMSQVHKEALNNPSRIEGIGSPVIEFWLKASNANMENHLFKISKRHLCEIIAEGTKQELDTGFKYKVKMLFKERVLVYHFWLNKYKENLQSEINSLELTDNDPDNNEELDTLKHRSEEASRDILPDDALKPYISDKVYESICTVVAKENKKLDGENKYIRQWLLGGFQTAHRVLDAIELLIKQEQEDNAASHISQLASTIERRWVITDSDSEESNSDDDDNSDDENSGDEDVYRLNNNIKMLELRFREHKNKEIQLLQRAKMLGILLSETVEEETEEREEQTKINPSYKEVFELYNTIDPFSKSDVARVTDLWKLKLMDRYKLYKYWVLEKKDKLKAQLLQLTEDYEDVIKRRKEVSEKKDFEILRQSSVIGMTTTGAARHRAVLQKVGSPIIIVEEAAEVLEAHIVTTLNNRCKHLILIGDHQQLRPKPKMYKLAKDFDLEISLFERLVKNRVSHVTLTEQHRMRPEISRFIKHIYPHLEDHESVQNYKDVRGVKSNVFFIQHSYEESAVEDSTSKSNVHEARFLTALCKYFLQQGYESRQITILAAYSGQVRCIRNQMEPEESLYEYVKVTSIDNYQGEENDIVLLSLVRSNQENEVGFLKTNNRVCVALSRAKIGMFAIGNLSLLSTKSELWKFIFDLAREKTVTNSSLQLVCINHPNHVRTVSTEEDFQKYAPEGGCDKKCEAKLPCGHTCPMMCHVINRQHYNMKSERLCLRTCREKKKCTKPCLNSYYCVCEIPVLKTLPNCGHTATVPCFEEVENIICSETCEKLMECGHICRGQCGKCSAEAQHQSCLEKVDKTWSPCQHSMSVECYNDITVDPCPKECDARLECGHKCKGTCGGCLSGRVHKSCAEECKKILPCGHLCTGPCGGQCVPCSSRCLTACRHGPCSKTTCGEKCDTCIENCAMICQHRHCTMRCVDECLEPLCTKRCNKRITSCNHKCMSLCGELCVCYDCEKDNFTLIDASNKKKHKQVKKLEMIERMKKFQVDDDTILMKIPECGHIFTLKQLDKWVEDFEPDTTHYISCPYPSCKTPIQRIARYEAKNKERAMRRENLKENLLTSACTSHAEIENLKYYKSSLKTVCAVDEGEFLTRKSNQIDINHALAITLQIKFSNVLQKIYDIHKKFNPHDFGIKKWKFIISSIQRNVTDQFYREMTLELHRLLLLEQIYILNKFLEDINCKPPEELRKQVRNVLKEKPKLTSNDRQIHQSLADSLYQLFDHLEPDDNYLAKVRELQGSSNKVSQVLDMPKNEDLDSVMKDGS
ncbi:NFX1-type zinc finger-containing protein 1-like [Physella acuta]|uniref:NFX1-type zinc finger-containing protein 1-like n=1 Tax=Physella acuta TaxID=109671 RepID=UPI0027DAD9E7|nr:NFX1-type zinc finger-containing protein 1-like [Physella acuta]